MNDELSNVLAKAIANTTGGPSAKQSPLGLTRRDQLSDGDAEHILAIIRSSDHTLKISSPTRLGDVIAVMHANRFPAGANTVCMSTAEAIGLGEELLKLRGGDCE